ncbi:MAG: sigma-70 family RNA polymerase sigma factor [Planctomycetes bacterium]|nr:sigma-70 family RNA polymerase sigma factor [Planctomycetota bacterium]
MDETAPETPPVTDGRDASGRESPSPDPSLGQVEERARRRAEEEAWIRRAQAGEEEAFAWLVRSYEVRAYRVARSLIANEEDARDVAQEAFLRVFRSLERFDFGYAFSTWLHRIVTNLAIDHLRKRRVVAKGGSLEDEESQSPELVDQRVEDPSAGLEREETVDEVHRSLEALAPHFQSVLVLRELEGLSCAEIADIVGATNVTVRWRLHRGRKLFQEEWERRERAALTGGRDSGRSANTPQDPSVEPADVEDSQ